MKSDKKYRQEYASRINRVIDYIEKNINNSLSLEELAQVAYFSKFHFHRLFKAITGETIWQFIQRLRLERTARELILSPEKSITEIALDNGFSGSAIFSRAFKSMYKKSPTEWRKSKNYQINSNIHQLLSNDDQDFKLPAFYIDPATNNQIWRIKMSNLKEVKIEVKELPEFHVVYVRHTGPYRGDGSLFERLFNELFKWAGPRDLMKFPETQLMTIYHDDPDITADEKQRISVCLTVEKDTGVSGEIGKMQLPSGKFAVGSFEIPDSKGYAEAWNLMFSKWLPDSGYQPDDRLSYEIYKNDPCQHPDKIHMVDICIPIKPL